MNFDLGNILTRAWQITWKYKVLWIFGILASCGRGSGGNSNSSSRISSGNNPFSPEMERQVVDLAQRAEKWFVQNTWIIYVFIAVFLFLILLQIFFSIIGSMGLIRGVYKVESGAEKLYFGELFQESLGYFGRALGAGIVVWLPVYAVFIGSILLMVFSALGAKQPEAVIGTGLIVFLVSFCCCLIPLMILLGIYFSQVLRALVVEDIGVFASLARGWKVFSENIGVMLLMAVILFVIGFVIGIVIAIPAIIVVLPLVTVLMQGNIQSWQPFIVVGLFLLLYSPIAWLLNGILTTYTESAWTLTYMRLTMPKENAPVFLEANA